MAHIQASRVQETTTTTGTGALTLGGAVSGFLAFSAVMADGDTAFCYVEAVDSNGVPNGAWEAFLGTWNTGGILSRTTVIESSNSNAAVNFGAGTKRVSIGPIAPRRPFVDVTGNLRQSYAASNTTPPADWLAAAHQRLSSGGGRVLPRFLNEDGIFTTLQSHMGRNAIVMAQASGGITGLGYHGWSTGLSAAGTATARTVTTTSRFTRARRNGYVSAATAGQAAGLFTLNSATHHHWTLGGASGGGFLFAARFGCSDAATVAGAHQFAGMHATSSTPPVATNPNTYTNAFGLAQLNGGANLNIVYGGSAAQTPIDLGANFPAGTLSVDWYELMLYARPDVNNKVAYRVERINTGHVADGVLTGTAGVALPANTSLLGPRIWRSNNATAAAVAIDVGGLYIESDI